MDDKQSERAAKAARAAAYSKEWRRRNAERLREYDKAYRNGNESYKAKKADTSHKYYLDVIKKSPDALAKMSAYSKQWAADNPKAYAEKKRRDAEVVKQIRKADPDNKINARQREAYRSLPEAERKAIIAARREYQKQYRKANAEKLQDDARRRYEANRETYAVDAKAYYEKKRDEFIARAEERQRKLSERGKYTAEDVATLYANQCGRCAGCAIEIENTRSRSAKRGFEVDHVMPVKLGGSNLPENLQLLCRPCNRKKHAKHPEEWARIAENLRTKNAPCPDSKPTPNSTATTTAAPPASALA